MVLIRFFAKLALFTLLPSALVSAAPNAYQAGEVDEKLRAAREMDFKNRLAVWELDLKRLAKTRSSDRSPASEGKTNSVENLSAQDIESILKQLDSRLTWDPRLAVMAVDFYKKCSSSSEFSEQVKAVCKSKLEALKKSKLYSSLGLKS